MNSIIGRLFDEEEPVHEPITVDGLLYILKADRRRTIIDAVAGRERVTKRELIDGMVGDDDRPSVFSSLHQQHLPRMVDFDVLEEVEPNVYEPGPAFETVADALEAVREVTA